MSRQSIARPRGGATLRVPSAFATIIGGRRTQVLEEPLGRVQEVAREEVVRRLTIGDLTNGVPVEIEQHGARIAQENRRMRRDDELGVPRRREVVDDLQE